MQRSQIYLAETDLKSLAAFAHARGTTQSALIREALAEYLARQTPLDKCALREQVFGAWSNNSECSSLDELRQEERQW